MTIDIVKVQQDPARDAYLVTGQVGTRQETIYITGLEVDQKLRELGAERQRLQYKPADVAPLIAQMATPELAAAFSL